MMKQKYRILAIDGGGIKGVIPISFLAAVEDRIGESITDHFDLIAGTSTGGIIALGLGLGLRASEILSFYENEGRNIFSSKKLPLFKSKYDSKPLKIALEKTLGNRLLRESQTRLLIPSFDLALNEIYIFKTSHHRRLTQDQNKSAVDVALATTAAPNIFPSHKISNGISLIDGGIWAKNPVGLAAVEAVAVLKWPMENLYILSLGCSESRFYFKKDLGWIEMLLKRQSIEMLFKGQSDEALGIAKLLCEDSPQNKHLFRYNPLVPAGSYKLDSVKDIPDLKGMGESLARKALHEIKDVFFDQKRKTFTPCS